MSCVHVVVPDGIDDPTRPSGGNVYDRRLQRGLSQLGWQVRQHVAPGTWPRASASARAALAAVLARIPDGSVVVVDGLVGSAVPALLVPEASRLRLVVLVHMPLGLDEGGGGRREADASGERAVLSRAVAVVATSRWTRSRLVERYALDGDRVHVAEPGVDVVDVAAGSGTGGSLLCVAAVAPHKGHDVLVAALAELRDRTWRCQLVGSLTRERAFVDQVRRQVRACGIAERVVFAGPLVGTDLDAAYASADVLVLPSYSETYGMVVTEALARGLPVVATDVGGVPQALGRAADGSRPGLMVPAGDPAALAGALRRWLDDEGLRDRLRASALARRPTLGGWDRTSGSVSDVLARVAA